MRSARRHPGNTTPRKTLRTRINGEWSGQRNELKAPEDSAEDVFYITGIIGQPFDRWLPQMPDYIQPKKTLGPASLQSFIR